MVLSILWADERVVDDPVWDRRKVGVALFAPEDSVDARQSRDRHRRDVARTVASADGARAAGPGLLAQQIPRFGELARVVRDVRLGLEMELDDLDSLLDGHDFTASWIVSQPSRTEASRRSSSASSASASFILSTTNAAASSSVIFDLRTG